MKKKQFSDHISGSLLMDNKWKWYTEWYNDRRILGVSEKVVSKW